MYSYTSLFHVIAFPFFLYFAFVSHLKVNISCILTPRFSDVWTIDFMGISNKIVTFERSPGMCYVIGTRCCVVCVKGCEWACRLPFS
jgi:hypothetical protein